MVNQILQSALIRFHIFSIIFDPQHVSTTIMNEWCSSAMLPEKSSSCNPTSLVVAVIVTLCIAIFVLKI